MKKHHINPGIMLNQMLISFMTTLFFLKMYMFFGADILKQHEDSTGQEEVVLLPGRRATPPRLLLCYSSRDGAAHVKAVLQLGAFIQQHMATQVFQHLHRHCQLKHSNSFNNPNVLAH